MKCSIMITSLLAVSFAAVQWRPHGSNVDTHVTGGDEGTRYQSELNNFSAKRLRVSFEIKSPVASLDVRGIDFSLSTIDDCTDSSSIPSSTSTAQGVITLPSSTEDCTETSTVPSITSTAQGVATLSSSTEECTDSSPLPSISLTAQGITTVSSSTEDCTETSNIPSSMYTAQISLTSKASSATSTTRGVFTVLSSKSSSIPLTSASTFTSNTQTVLSINTIYLLTTTVIAASTRLSESNAASNSTVFTSSTVLVTTTITAAPSASTISSLVVNSGIPSVTPGFAIPQSEKRGNGTGIGSAWSSILATTPLSTVFELTTSTLIPTNSIPAPESQVSASSSGFGGTVATVTSFATLTITSTTVTSTVTITTPASGTSASSSSNAPSSAQGHSSVGLPGTALSSTASTSLSHSSSQAAPNKSSPIPSQSDLSVGPLYSAEVLSNIPSSNPGAPSLVSIGTASAFGGTVAFSFIQPKITNATLSIATSPAYSASSSLQAAGVCACVPITVTITTIQSVTTSPNPSFSSLQTLLILGSKLPVSSSGTANTATLSTSALGPYSYCTSTAPLPGFVGLQLSSDDNWAGCSTPGVTPLSSTIVPASVTASSTQVPEMPWMGNYSSAPTPLSITPSSLAIVPLSNATVSAAHPVLTGGSTENGFKHMVAFLVSFLALAVLF